MKVRTPRTVLEAEAIRDELRALLDLTDPGPRRPPRVAGAPPRYRLPETVRVSDRLSRQALIENCRSVLIGSDQREKMG
jgi:deoxyribonuclease V